VFDSLIHVHFTHVCDDCSQTEESESIKVHVCDDFSQTEESESLTLASNYLPRQTYINER
jgi:hypothetical protein